ncbi:MAG: 8-oxo-dGTP diphosphatase MutT [Deltaproteobacteria bacterium]|nr:8-oxo-dGTP diphosphatase MutT [Deltaproteobacteria bacterium]MBI2501474.1 8-oxo-dGTP diphosphatase MutT [Deltaproteobacteria bacterium]
MAQKEGNKKKIEAVAAVIQDKGKFLITLRLETSPMGHCWEFPGGKIEPGESVEQCAIRECREEVGITIDPIRRLKDLWYDYPHGHIHLYFVLCRWVAGLPRPIECREARWISPGEFASYEFPPADQTVIEELIQSGL